MRKTGDSGMKKQSTNAMTVRAGENMAMVSHLMRNPRE